MEPSRAQGAHESKKKIRLVESRLLAEIALNNFTLDEIIASFEAIEKLIHQYGKMVTQYAERNNTILKLNPDGKRVHALLVGLARNKMDFGKGYCPCMVKRISGEPSEDGKRICPCNWHRQDIELDGECECGMFVKA